MSHRSPLPTAFALAWLAACSAPSAGEEPPSGDDDDSTEDDSQGDDDDSAIDDDDSWGGDWDLIEPFDELDTQRWDLGFWQLGDTQLLAKNAVVEDGVLELRGLYKAP